MHKKQPSDSKPSIRVFYRDKSWEILFYVTALFIFSICLLLLLYDNELLISVHN